MVLLCRLADVQPLCIHAASINVVAAVAAAAAAAAAVDIVAAVAVCEIVSAAQGKVNSCYGSGLQSLAMDAAIVTNLCNFKLYLC